MVQNNFIEVFSSLKNEELLALKLKIFERLFFIQQTPNSLEIVLTLTSFGYKEFIDEASNIFNILLELHGWEPLKSIDLMEHTICRSHFGSLEPDFRYPFPIRNPDDVFDVDALHHNLNAKQSCYMCIPNLDASPFQIEKIVDWVQEKTGLYITYATIGEDGVDGPLKSYLKQGSCITNSVIFLAFDDDLAYCETSLGFICPYLKKNKLLPTPEMAAKWVYQTQSMETGQMSIFNLILNGQKVADCSFEGREYSYFNHGFMTLNLLALYPPQWKELEKRQNEHKFSIRYSPPLS